MRVKWDEHEAALIVEMYYSVKEGKISRVEGASVISDRLRRYGLIRKIEVDDKFRNLNGILMQLNAVEYADTGGKTGLSSCSKLFKSMIEIYKNDNSAFRELLKQANLAIPDTKTSYNISKKKIDENMMNREKLIEIMDESFSYGFKTESPIALMRFRRFYAEKYNEEIADNDELLYREIKSFCFEVDGKLYHISAENKKYVDRLIGRISNECNLVYYDRLYEIYNDDLIQHGVLSTEILKTVIESLFQGENVKKNYFVIESEKGKITEKICLTDEVCRVWGEEKVRNYSYLIERLPYIPEEKIKYVLAQTDLFIWNSTEEYTRSDMFVLNSEDAEQIIERAKELCEVNGSATFDELPIENVVNENYELSETAIFSYLYDNLLSEEFSRNGRVIRISSSADDAVALFQTFCREKRHYSTEELFEKWEEITGDNRRAHPLEYGADVLVRINEDEYVSDDSVSFDISKIDEVLENISPQKYMGIKEVTSFAAFPDCGYTWNLFLVESYCRRFSRKYKFLTKIANSKNAGAIVEKSMTDDYDELLSIVVAESGIELEAEKIFDYLISNGYLYRHAYKGMDSLIYRANERRERSN